MGLPIGRKLVKSGSTWARLCGTHIFGTTGWIYTIRSSMELSRPVVVQHQGHLTLTLDFQGQIFKMLYFRNGRANWHGTKGMCVDRMLDPHCDFELWPHPYPWPLNFKVKFWKVVTQQWDARLTWNERDVSRWDVRPTLWLWTMTSPMTLTLDFQGQIFKMLYLRNGRADWHGTKGT